MNAAQEIHVWQIPLAQATPVDDTALDPEERRRAGAFKFETDRRRFLASHAALRAVLAHYTGAAPGSLRVDKAADGKPFLRGSNWQFNLSHSEDLAVLAVAREVTLGIDVERVRAFKPRPNSATADGGAQEVMALAERHCSPAEVRHLSALAEPARSRDFFRCWTRKEAYVKAIGTGILTDLRAIEAGFEATMRIGAMHVRSLPIDTDWSKGGYLAALAVNTASASLRLLRFPEHLDAV